MSRPDSATGASRGHVAHVPPGPYETGYFVLSGLFLSMLLLTNIIGTKLFSMPLDLPILGIFLRAADAVIQRLISGQGGGEALTLTAGIITYPITFLITDVVSETYGRRRADLMVWLGFGASFLMLGILRIARALPGSPIWNVPEGFAGVFAPERLLESGAADVVAAQAAFQFTFDAPGTLLFASMTAYLTAQLVDNRLFHFWRRLTNGRALWFRNNASTMISQLVDTIIVNTIFLHFYWKMPWDAIAAVILASYTVKWAFAFLDTPFCYVGVLVARRLTLGRSPS